MLFLRDFLSLSDTEIELVVHDMFDTIAVEDIKRNPKRDEISMNIQTGGWDDGEEKHAFWDNIVICNPFVYGEDAIQIESFDPGREAYLKLKQFCFAKGIVNPEWINDNPYILDDTTM